ncbi:lysylphosphatidylglycerol synthase domain-containing protein [Rhodoblastus acidophilus]|uniref:Lysylphosphatidylglycerol synthase domain-containing protein n=1 Tax=Candidatus Rhodoblastus alkanivorans TaxID=2954117 RepID=A0ABS9Z4Q3_9HYPH|nr:lysylphosphatidylglycerol synthase domain-containing protein [Candidatus Rhodoblastus alkanivorans]MCI4677608.1 lysylphosphatidylglycerol synthase domain-containing protein [Candidatus Rhodoblastus alkanivorans]MCI4682660.1 lysylphosphatidylglycerol synthase domain-containing protein [Candidatus Rhodoblastus alkanivorans]
MTPSVREPGAAAAGAPSLGFFPPARGEIADGPERPGGDPAQAASAMERMGSDQEQEAEPQNVAPTSFSSTRQSERAAIVAKAERRRKLVSRVGAAASVILVGLAVFVLSRVLAHLDMAQLRAAFAATSARQIALGLLFTASSYLMLTGYDAIALRQLKLRVPYRTTALASFTSYAVSFTLGFPIFTGGTVRYWIYSRAGVRPGKIASLTVVAGVTFWLGMAVVIALGLIVEARPVSNIDHLAVEFNRLIGFGVLLAIGVYLYWVSARPRRARWQGLSLELPGLGLSLGQIALGVMDLCSAAAALYVLLPTREGLDFFTFAAVYVFACLLGIASHAPGGIGVFEATMLKVLPSPSQEALLASLLMFRVLYYVIPFVLALALLGANEGGRRWDALREAMNRAQSEGEKDA